MTIASALKKARQSKRVCGLSRRGTGRGYEVRKTIEVLAHPDLVILADRVERLQEALESIIKGNPRCSTPRAILAWAQDVAREALGRCVIKPRAHCNFVQGFITRPGPRPDATNINRARVPAQQKDKTMADKKQPKVTVWLTRRGYKDAQTLDDMKNPEPLYAVQRTQNTTTPRVGDRLDERDIQDLIDKGVTVNIG